MKRIRVGAVLLLGLAGCSPTIKVEAPDKPIVINMNIRIEQEVRVKVDREISDMIMSDPTLFGIPVGKEGAK
ncbi:MAG TPA: YnbE family lipoprotein [Rhodospirillaceae bacterium]|nr:MAG: hypothetical protein A2018_03555 [Alphaproteobacteria bacterium GWF2_58_20]HAU29644.1 YnbE family lipoprotein [Rhodospirillaceae bacterium]